MCRFKNNKVFFLLTICLFAFSGISYAQYPVRIITNVVQPVPPYLPQIKADIIGNRSGQLNQDISHHISILLTNTGVAPAHIKLAGSIERVSPAPMGVSLRSDYQPANPVIMNPQQMVQLDQNMIQNAFGNFSENSLVYTNVDLTTLQQNGFDYKLPEGTYRVCVNAYDYDKAGFSAPLSAPGSGCAYFTICYTASAPQLISPVSTQMQLMPVMRNFSFRAIRRMPGKRSAFNSHLNDGFQTFTPLTPQIQFTWTPPVTTCGLPLGALTYDLIIRQVFDGQTMTDALNNPPVFRQQNLHSTTFLLDTLRYPHVLVNGQKYIIRVKANFMSMPGSPLEIANQGYSQIGALAYQTEGNTPGNSGLAKNDSTGKSKSPADTSKNNSTASAPIALGGSCLNTPSIANKKSLDSAVDISGQDVKIGEFTMHIDAGVQRNKDSSYQGTGYITWSPFGHPVELKVRFNKIKINTDTVVYSGGVVTSTDQSFDKWAPLATADDITDTLKNLTGYNIQNSDYQDLENHINTADHMINEISGNTPVAFPLGLNNESSGSPASNITLAIMGITFTPAGTSMNVLFNLNVPEANGWLSLAGSCFQIKPDGFSFSQGMLYMPTDRDMTWNGMSFTFKGCKYQGASNSVDTSKGTYLTWDGNGLKKIMAKADLTLPANTIVPEKNGKMLTGKADTIHLKFDFSDWNDWIASADPMDSFEIKSLPGFPISVSGGIVYDHSATRDPAGISFPAEYANPPQHGAFEGLYIKDLTMSLPPDFKKISGDKASFGFHNFMIDGDGITTEILANDIIDIGQGRLGGWAFSIDTFEVGFIKNNPLSAGVKMNGRLKLPISDSSLEYTCSLNPGTDSTGDRINYLFSIQPAGSYPMSLWKATLTLDPTTHFTIDKDALGMAINSSLDGEIKVDVHVSAMPKLTLPALSFQGMALGNRDSTGKKAGFNFQLGTLKLGGVTLTQAINQVKGAVKNDYEYISPAAPLLAGPHPPENIGNYAESASADNSGSSQGSVASLGFNLSDFSPYFNAVSTNDYELGVYFDAMVNIGSGDKSLVSGAAHLGLIGEVKFPGNSAPVASFKKVAVDSVAIHGDIGPVKVDGSLQFLTNDPTYGDGISGTLSAAFPIMQLSAAARFGTVNSLHYWAVAGSVYLATGIAVGPVTFNGFGGGIAYNMKMAPLDDNAINGSSGTATPPINLTPQSGSVVLSAKVFLSLISAQTLNGSLALTADINTTGGLSVGALDLSGKAYIMSNPPTNTSAVVNIDPMDMRYDLTHKIFDAYIQSKLKYGPISASVPIWVHVDSLINYMYVGRPDKGDTTDEAVITIVNIGDSTKDSYVNLGGSAYFDAGKTLPQFPPLPAEITNNLPAGADPAANAGTVQAMLREMGAAGNPGFMFGAEIQGEIKLAFSFLYARATAMAGFDVALEKIKTNNIPPGCQQPDGTFGLNNWYAIGQLYAYLGLDVGAHVNTFPFKGDYSLVSFSVVALLQAGLPNPTWMLGQVHVKGSILNGAVSVDKDFPISVGDQCTVQVNPLDGIKLITDAGPKDNAGVFDKPYVVFMLPMDGRTFPINVSSDKTHPQPYTRTFRFYADQFALFKVTASGSDSGISGQPEMDPNGESISLYRNNMLDPHTKYKIYVHCYAQELIGGQWGNPTEGATSQDTSMFFTTGDAPDHIVPENIVYTYPIDGQQFLLKNEFNSQGVVKMGNWQGNLFPSPDASRGIASYKYELKFIPENGGDTITSVFMPDPALNELDFSIPTSLQNSTIYRMEARVIPQYIEAPANHLNLHKIQNVAQLNEQVKVMQKDRNGNLVSTNETLNTEVRLNTQKAAQQPQSVHVMPQPIYSIRFQTSRFNLFTDKMAAYTSFQETSLGQYPDNYSMIKSTTPGFEGWDEFEMNGYTSQNTTAAGEAGMHFDPFFSASVPFNINNSTDKFLADSVYDPIIMLSREQYFTGCTPFTIDLGDDEKRTFYSNEADDYYPEYTVTNETPYIPKLGPPAPYTASPVGNNSGGGGRFSVQLHLKAPEGVLERSGLTVLQMPSYESEISMLGGGAYANSHSGHQRQQQQSSSQPSTPLPPPDPKVISLRWDRFKYAHADILLMEQFGVNFVNQGGLLSPGQSLAAGEFGTISIPLNVNRGYYLYFPSNDPAWGVANHFANLQTWGLYEGDAGNRAIVFQYKLPWCIFCGGEAVTKHINYNGPVHQ